MSGRRVYSPRTPGKSAPLWFYRTTVIVFGPIFVVLSFLWTLIEEIVSAFRTAWRVDVVGFWKEARKHWNGDRPL